MFNMAGEAAAWNSLGEKIIKSPNNDDLRTRFAILLESDHETETEAPSPRAEFIHLQFALASLTPDDSEWMGLATQADGLLLRGQIGMRQSCSPNYTNLTITTCSPLLRSRRTTPCCFTLDAPTRCGKSGRACYNAMTQRLVFLSFCSLTNRDRRNIIEYSTMAPKVRSTRTTETPLNCNPFACVAVCRRE
jgi:hypothetical protein